MKATAACLVALVSIFQCFQVDSFGFSQCDPVKHLDGFVPDNFTGLWYIYKMGNPIRRCMTVSLKRTETGFDAIKTVELDFGFMGKPTYQSKGTFTVDSKVPAQMEAVWLGFIKIGITVINTDYTNYAALSRCNWGKTQSAIILSRQPTLNSTIVNQVEQELTSIGFDVNKLKVIDHQNCKST